MREKKLTWPNLFFGTIKLKKLILLFFSVTIFLFPYTAFSASDGFLDPDASEGTTDIDLDISNLIRITGIVDLEFGNYNGTGNPSLDDNVCVYTNLDTGNYLITASGSGTSSDFAVTDGNSHVIPYTVRWNDATGTSGNVALTKTVASATQSGAHTTSQTCSGSSNANFQVTFTQTQLLSVPAGAYTGTLTLVVEPD